MVSNANLRGAYGLARNVTLGMLLESFLVAAVASMLAIRFYLTLAGFPQVGGAGLHIAHMLWGGLFMLIALVLLLAFLGRRAKRIAAVLGGIGFGTFIDELGKFITSDNNYFYKPTIAIIYGVFIVLFVSTWLLQRRPFSQRELIANALDEVKEVVLRGGDPAEGAEVVRMLHAAGKTADPLLLSLADVVGRVEQRPAPPARWPAAPVRFIAWCHVRYQRLIGASAFRTLLLGAFVLYVIAAVGALGLAVETLLATNTLHAPPLLPQLTAGTGMSLFVERSLFVSFLLSAALVAVGLFSLRRSRLSALGWFKRAVLVSIFLVQVFLFYSQELEALTGLAINLVMLIALNSIIAAERHAVLRARAQAYVHV